VAIAFNTAYLVVTVASVRPSKGGKSAPSEVEAESKASRDQTQNPGPRSTLTPNGEVEGPVDDAGQAPRAQTVFQRPSAGGA